ncbi:MAG: prolyl oligopeptidase family serine peptidase [Spirochaetales bacterium]|nr:prolyl oligopeptidase family serine peptidase [Spirochaetales bacterium]
MNKSINKYLSLLLILTLSVFSYINRQEIKRYYLAIKTNSTSFKSNEIDGELKYRIFEPKDLSREVPLIIYLHGAAQRGEDNIKQLDDVAFAFTSKKVQKNYPCYFIAPKHNSKEGYWINYIDKPGPLGHYSQKTMKESDEEKLIVELIVKLMNEKPIDPSRIYITGYSMGATGTWDIISRYPDLFAAAIPIAGLTDTATACKLNNIGIWIHHGMLDPLVPIEISTEMAQELEKYNNNVMMTAYPNKGHGIIHEVYSNNKVIEWLFSQTILIKEPKTN